MAQVVFFHMVTVLLKSLCGDILAALSAASAAGIILFFLRTLNQVWQVDFISGTNYVWLIIALWKVVLRRTLKLYLGSMGKIVIVVSSVCLEQEKEELRHCFLDAFSDLPLCFSMYAASLILIGKFFKGINCILMNFIPSKSLFSQCPMTVRHSKSVS